MKNKENFCPNHPEKKSYSKGLCRSCYEKQLINNNPEFKQKQLLNSRNWNKKNKEYKSKYDKEYRIKNPVDKDEKYYKSILRNLGITKEDYLGLIKKSNNKCNICGKHPYENKRLHLDHCHKTGKVRGVLCTRCNWYLHTVEKNPNILNIIKEYLNL
jgi:hypothetical protein